MGAPVYAADSGVVVYAAGIGGGYGLMVMIDHGNGFHTLYAHLSQITFAAGRTWPRVRPSPCRAAPATQPAHTSTLKSALWARLSTRTITYNKRNCSAAKDFCDRGLCPSKKREVSFENAARSLSKLTTKCFFGSRRERFQTRQPDRAEQLPINNKSKNKSWTLAFRAEVLKRRSLLRKTMVTRP